MIVGQKGVLTYWKHLFWEMFKRYQIGYISEVRCEQCKAACGECGLKNKLDERTENQGEITVSINALLITGPI